MKNFTAALDYETTDKYDITVRVSDDGTTPGPSAMFLDVDLSIAVGAINEGAPTFTSAPYTVNVDEDVAVGYDVFSGVCFNVLLYNKQDRSVSLSKCELKTIFQCLPSHNRNSIINEI